MRGRLKCGNIHMNDPEVVRALLQVVAQAARDNANHHRLRVRGAYYFELPDGPCRSEGGWYAILSDQGAPLYIGQADDLNKRLNSKDGTRDDFANPKRKFDGKRNFIKALSSIGFLPELRVVTISESQVASRLGVRQPLAKLDRDNVEKALSMCRGLIKWIPPGPSALSAA